MVGDILALLKPTIEAYLQSKHFSGTAPDEPLIIDVGDLVTH